MVPIIPDRVAKLIGSNLPLHIQWAEKAATNAAYRVFLARTTLTAEARERALGELAYANKHLAAYNPKLVVRGLS